MTSFHRFFYPFQFISYFVFLHKQPLEESSNLLFLGKKRRFFFLKAYQSVVSSCSSCWLLFQASHKCLHVVATVHAQPNVYLFNPIICGNRKISMVTKAVESRWRALQDALGPSCDKETHLRCRLDRTLALFQGLKQGLLSQIETTVGSMCI